MLDGKTKILLALPAKSLTRRMEYVVIACKSLDLLVAPSRKTPQVVFYISPWGMTYAALMAGDGMNS